MQCGIESTIGNLSGLSLHKSEKISLNYCNRHLVGKGLIDAEEGVQLEVLCTSLVGTCESEDFWEESTLRNGDHQAREREAMGCACYL